MITVFPVGMKQSESKSYGLDLICFVQFNLLLLSKYEANSKKALCLYPYPKLFLMLANMNIHAFSL